MKRLAIIIQTVMILSQVSVAQFLSVNIPGSQVRKLNSAIVNQEYELHISLPAGYEAGTKKFPVVYLMDSQWDFPLVKSIYGEQYYDGFIPELIIVGVTWGGKNPNPDSLRVRDYTPTTESRMIQSGGADKFLSFMQEELFPFIKENYRTNDERILMGCSLGGLLTLYTLFTHADMFTGYAAASPAVGWDNQILYKYEKEFAVKKLNRPVRLYMTVGDVERGRPIFEKIAAQMASRNYAAATVQSKILENTGHSSTKSETYSRGLQYIFERPVLQFSNEALAKYTGFYKIGGGATIEFKTEDNQLNLYFSTNNKFRLYAAGENEFYATSELLNLHFKMKNDKVEGVELERYGGSQLAIKIK